MWYADGNSTSLMMAWILGLSVDHKYRIVDRQWLKDPEIVVRFQVGAIYLCLLQGSEAHRT